MKRFVDQPYGAYTVYASRKSGIAVKCPKCGGLGAVTADDSTACFMCTSCGYSAAKGCRIYRYEVHNQCKGCGRYYRVRILEESKQRVPMLHVACPYCGAIMPGKVHKTASGYFVIGDIRNSREPFFGYELWFSAHLGDQPIWALNREHLAYLIGYLSAGLREKPVGRQALRTQADHLPTYMKTAKNRARVVKLLKKLQQK